MVGEEAGNAADGVAFAGAQVDAPVAVEIDRITPLAAGHELRDAHRSGVGAADFEGIHAVLACEQKEVFELAAEEGGARRVFEGQRGQGFEHAEAPGIAPVLGFDADDGDDDLARHAVDGFGTHQLGAVFLPKREAALDAAGVEEALAVARPGALLFGHCGRHDGAQNGGIGSGDAEGACQLVGVETVPLGHLGDEFPCFGQLDEGRWRRRFLVFGGVRGRGEQQAGRQGEQQAGKTLVQDHLRLGARQRVSTRVQSSSSCTAFVAAVSGFAS